MFRRADPSSEHLIAYWGAVYRFEHAGRSWVLTFAGPEWGLPSAATTDLPPRWGIITACNPGSRRLDARENERRTRDLATALDGMGLIHKPSVNSAPDGSWPEPGRVVWGVERGSLLGLARRFGQRAVVWASRGRIGLLETDCERWIVREIRLHEACAESQDRVC